MLKWKITYLLSYALMSELCLELCKLHICVKLNEHIIPHDLSMIQIAFYASMEALHFWQEWKRGCEW